MLPRVSQKSNNAATTEALRGGAPEAWCPQIREVVQIDARGRYLNPSQPEEITLTVGASNVVPGRYTLSRGGLSLVADVPGPLVDEDDVAAAIHAAAVALGFDALLNDNMVAAEVTGSRGAVTVDVRPSTVIEIVVGGDPDDGTYSVTFDEVMYNGITFGPYTLTVERDTTPATNADIAAEFAVEALATLGFMDFIADADASGATVTLTFVPGVSAVEIGDDTTPAGATLTVSDDTPTDTPDIDVDHAYVFRLDGYSVIDSCHVLGAQIRVREAFDATAEIDASKGPVNLLTAFDGSAVGIHDGLQPEIHTDDGTLLVRVADDVPIENGRATLYVTIAPHALVHDRRKQ